MKNFQITSKENGKKYWISRSVAVCSIITCMNESGKEYVLISKRGPGCPDEVGKYQFTCGYLDWDESLKDAVVREAYEELGLHIPSHGCIRFLGIDDETNGENKVKQNITIRYRVHLRYEYVSDLLRTGIINPDTLSRGGEKDEVSEIRLIETGSDQIKESEWAFNHYDIYKKL